MKNIKFSKNNALLLSILLLFVTIIGNIYKFYILPEKYSYDYVKTLQIMNGQLHVDDHTFNFAANFFGKTNFLSLNTLESWSILLSFIGIAVLMYLYKRNCVRLLSSVIYMYMSVFLMTIYVFSIGKEWIQFLVFLGIIFTYKISKLSDKKKQIITVLLCMLEGVLFRSYFFVVAALFAYIIVMMNNKLKAKHKAIISCIVGIVLVITFSQFTKSSFIYLVNLRNGLNVSGQSIDRATMINDLIQNPSSNPIIFLINYTINVFRMAFPIELLLKRNIMYFIFFIYQLFIVRYLILLLKNINTLAKVKDMSIFIIIIAYFLTLVLFEPDYGSLVRHECVIFPIVLLFLCSYEQGEFKNVR